MHYSSRGALSCRVAPLLLVVCCGGEASVGQNRESLVTEGNVGTVVWGEGEDLLSDRLRAFDLNQDGFCDLVTVTKTGKVRIAFGPLPAVMASDSASLEVDGTDATAADVNGDAVPDLVVAGGSLGMLSRVYPGPIQPGSSLGEPLLEVSGVGAKRVENLGDLNGDGLDDVAFVEPGRANYEAHSSAAVKIAMSPKQGLVPLSELVTISGRAQVINPTSVNRYDDHRLFGDLFVSKLGDIDGDGLGDIAVSAPEFIDVVPWQGDQVLSMVFIYKGPVAADGKLLYLESAPATLRSAQAMVPVAAESAGSFYVGQTAGHSQFGRTILPLGDVTGDGRDDFAASLGLRGWTYNGATGEMAPSGGLEIYSGFPPLPQEIVAEGGFAFPAIDAGDINGDGDRDFAFGSGMFVEAQENNILPSVSLGGGTVKPIAGLDSVSLREVALQSFGASASLEVSASTMAAGDFNADGFSDLVFFAEATNRSAALVVYGP